MTSNEDYHIDGEYYYKRSNEFGTEVRFFMLNLDENIEEQKRFIEEHRINGLSFTKNPNSANEVKMDEHYHLASDIVVGLNNELLTLNLMRFDEIESLDFLDCAPNLKRLKLQCKLKRPYDFTKLSMIEDMELLYGKSFSSIFGCNSIKKLQIFKIDNYAVENIQNLFQLESLWIRQSSPISIDGLRELKALKNLSFFHLLKLETIASIQECQTIETLYINCCKKIIDWDVIGKLQFLTELHICNCGVLDNVSFLKALEHLESVNIYGENMKLIDGNVRWMYDMPRLRTITLPWRKDFDISLEEYRARN